MAGNANSGKRSKRVSARYEDVAGGVIDLTAKGVRWAKLEWDRLTDDQKISLIKAFAPKFVVEKKEVSGMNGQPITFTWDNK